MASPDCVYEAFGEIDAGRDVAGTYANLPEDRSIESIVGVNAAVLKTLSRDILKEMRQCDPTRR